MSFVFIDQTVDGWQWWIIIFDELLLRCDLGRECDPLKRNLSPNLLHLGTHLQSALISDNERSLEGDATAEITDPL